MKAALLNENEHTLQISDVEPPTIGSGEALIKVEATGLCRSDLHIISGILKPPTYPHILGHEIAGRIVEAKPSNATEEGILEEAAENNYSVLLYSYVTCGYCSYCLTGRTNLCVTLKRLGFELPGGFAEYVKAPIRNVVPRPLGPEYAILPDAGATMIHAFKKVGVKPGMSIVVAGSGGLGSMAIQLGKLLGCNVIALDIQQEKLAFAKELGADMVLNVAHLSNEELREQVRDYTDGKMADVFIDLVGTNASQQMALATLARDSKLIQLGYGDSRYEALSLKDVVYNEIQIIGSLAATIQDLYDVVALAARGKIRSIVTSAYNLEEINTAISELEENKIVGRSIIIP